MSLVFQRISSPFRDLMAGSARPVRSTRDDALEIATRSALTWLSSIAVLNLLWYAAFHFAGH
jgi:hypothetical protein